MNKWSSSVTWSAPFSAISGASFVDLYLDLQVPLYMQFQVYYQVQSKFYDEAHIKRIYHCSDALCSASPGALTVSLLLSYI